MRRSVFALAMSVMRLSGCSSLASPAAMSGKAVQ
jgi:hypothetical protein